MSAAAARCGRIVALVLAALLAGCARERAPDDVVRLYFASIGRDPIRAASLLTESFQLRHGLRHATSVQVADWKRRVHAGEHASSVSQRAAGSVARTRSEAEALWFATQIKDGYAQQAARLSVTPISTHTQDATAEVAVRISSPGVPSFVQRFFLARGPDARWRIDRIEQEGVTDASVADAFVAAPTDAMRRRLAAVLGVPAD